MFFGYDIYLKASGVSRCRRSSSCWSFFLNEVSELLAAASLKCWLLWFWPATHCGQVGYFGCFQDEFQRRPIPQKFPSIMWSGKWSTWWFPFFALWMLIEQGARRTCSYCAWCLVIFRAQTPISPIRDWDVYCLRIGYSEPYDSFAKLEVPPIAARVSLVFFSCWADLVGIFF